MHHLSLAIAGLALAFSTAVSAQAHPHGGPHARSAAHPQANSALRAYASCHFEDGLAIAQVLPLPPDVAGRSVETMHGTAHLPLLRGETLFFAYPGTDTFAKVKVEQLPAGSYDQEKADLVSNFEQILATDDGTRNYALKPNLNGFAIYGLDRSRLEGGAVGVYLLLDDRSGIAVTIHFVDADPDQRKFSNIAEYAGLRDHFLNAYTACIHSAPAISTPRTLSASAHTR